jgi:hypothetical protein
MPKDSYNGLAGGEKWGCAVAALVAVPLFLFLLAVDAVGDCAPDSGCTKGFWTNVLLPSAMIVTLIFFGVRWAIGRARH